MLCCGRLRPHVGRLGPLYVGFFFEGRAQNRIPQPLCSLPKLRLVMVLFSWDPHLHQPKPHTNINPTPTLCQPQAYLCITPEPILHQPQTHAMCHFYILQPPRLASRSLSLDPSQKRPVEAPMTLSFGPFWGHSLVPTLGHKDVPSKLLRIPMEGS